MKKSFWKEHATSSCIGATDEDIHDEASQGIESLTLLTRSKLDFD